MASVQRQLEAVHAITRVLNAAGSLAEAVPRVLETLATSVGFTGATWWRGGTGQTFELLAGWRHDKPYSSEARGEAWSSRQPAWWPDGTVAVPLVCGAEVYGVIELLTQTPEEPREGLLLTLAAIGQQLGQFIDRHKSTRNERMEEVANAVPDIVWTLTAAGQTNFYNQRWYEYTGLTPGDDALTAFTRACHADDQEAVRTAWANSVSAGTPYEVEVRIKRAQDGAWRWHLARCLPLTDAAGKVIRWVGSATDIDDHKRAEETSKLLAQASVLLNGSLDYEATLQTIAKLAVPKVADWCTVWLQDEGESLPRQLVVAHVDPAKVLWAKDLQRHFPQDPNAKTGTMAVIRTGQPEFYPDVPDAMLVAVAKSDEQLRLLREIGFSSVMTVPLTAHGRTFGALTLIRAESRTRYTKRDLAAAQELAGLAAGAVSNARLYRDAQRAIRVRDEFLAAASHELKTPLTPLQLQVQSLQKLGQQPPDEVSPRIASKLDVIGRQVSRMERLINSMLDVSQVTAEGLELALEPLDLSAVVREVGERFLAEQGQAEGALMIDAPKPVVGSWDPLRVDQIVVNLLSNALKFGEGKPIDVTVKNMGGDAELTVHDHGIGIAADDHQRIFERFERAIATTNYGGLGLGLWITRELVERQGGTITVDSAPGKGSTFTVLLPKEPRSASARRPVEGKELTH